VTKEELRIYFNGEQAGFKQGVRAGREMVLKQLRTEDIERIKDEMYKRTPADDKWDPDISHFSPWDDEKGCVIRTAANHYKKPVERQPESLL